MAPKITSWTRSILERPADVFLGIALLFGFLFVFLTPPMQAPDEHHHFFRAYQVSTGTLAPTLFKNKIETGVGGDIAESVKKTGYVLLGDLPGKTDHKISLSLIRNYFHVPVNEKLVSATHFEPASSSSFVPYLPSALGMRVAIWLGGTVLSVFYAGRFLNFLVWLILSYLAIRLIPFGKWVYVVLLLSPVIIFQAASLSPDALTNGMSFLSVATVLKLIVERERMRWPWQLALLIMAAALALSKQAYFLIGFLAWMIPVKQFKNRRSYFIFAGAIAVVCLGSALAWGLIAHNFLPLLNKNYQLGGEVDSIKQIKVLLKHPLVFPKALGRTFSSSYGDYIVLEFNGRVGWSDVRLPVWLVILQYCLLITVIAASEVRDNVLSRIMRWWGIALATAMAFALAVVIYVTWTPVALPLVIGLQGRYFIPIIALTAPFLIPPKKVWPIQPVRLQGAIIVVTTLVLSITLGFLVRRYYL